MTKLQTTPTFLALIILIFNSCQNKIEKKATNYTYFDVIDTMNQQIDTLFAITNEENLQYGVKVAYINQNKDTIIPFGRYAYFGSDVLVHVANVIEHSEDTIYGRLIALNREEKILYDIVLFDNGPEEFHDGLVRVLRNGKMGFANKYGQLIIPCAYEYAQWFENDTAEVALMAVEYFDMDEHLSVKSDDWIKINKKGNILQK